MLSEGPPHLARVFDFRCADFQVFKRDALTVEHAVDVVIRVNEELWRIGEGLVLGEPCGLRVPVWTHDT